MWGFDCIDKVPRSWVDVVYNSICVSEDLAWYSRPGVCTGGLKMTNSPTINSRTRWDCGEDDLMESLEGNPSMWTSWNAIEPLQWTFLQWFRSSTDLFCIWNFVVENSSSIFRKMNLKIGLLLKTKTDSSTKEQSCSEINSTFKCSKQSRIGVCLNRTWEIKLKIRISVIEWGQIFSVSRPVSPKIGGHSVLIHWYWGFMIRNTSVRYSVESR